MAGVFEPLDLGDVPYEGLPAGLPRPYVQNALSWVTMAEDGHRRRNTVMGGTMKLGKALATGVAEERPPAADREVELPEDIRDMEPAPEEVPAAR